MPQPEAISTAWDPSLHQAGLSRPAQMDHLKDLRFGSPGVIFWGETWWNMVKPPVLGKENGKQTGKLVVGLKYLDT